MLRRRRCSKRCRVKLCTFVPFDLWRFCRGFCLWTGCVYLAVAIAVYLVVRTAASAALDVVDRYLVLERVASSRSTELALIRFNLKWRIYLKAV